MPDSIPFHLSRYCKLAAFGCLILIASGVSYSQAIQAPQEDKPFLTLNIKDSNLREVLLLLTRDSSFSLIMEPGIDVVLPAVDLKNVTLEEALKSLLPSINLEYRFEGNLLRVHRPRMQTRIFYLNYIAASRKGKRDMRMSSRSEVGGGSGNSGGGASGGSSGSGKSGSGGGGGSSSENESTIVTSNSAEIWADLQLGLENIIFTAHEAGASVLQVEAGPIATASRDAAGRRLIINPQAGLIMIHAETPAIEEAAGYIEAVEGSVQRQVLIEARVVEVTLAKNYQMGIDWTALLNPTSHFAGLLPGANGVINPSARLSTGSALNQDVNASLGRVQYSIGNGKVGAVIDALSRQGQLRVLSSPHVSAMNNQKAVIRVVREEVFFTQTSTVSQSVGPTVIVQDIQNQIVPIGVVLDIIPQISPKGEITLSINPSISELVEVRTFSSDDGKATSTQPVIDRRDLDTVAKVNSGETVLIAGIMRERKSEDVRGVPWLMNLPLIGNAFRRTEQSSARTELVIFITPTILSGKPYEELTEQEKQRLKQLEQPFKLGTVEPFKEGIKGEFGIKK
jgi:MSHA type pilus biogenesis protein MshL